MESPRVCEGSLVVRADATYRARLQHRAQALSGYGAGRPARSARSPTRGVAVRGQRAEELPRVRELLRRSPTPSPLLQGRLSFEVQHAGLAEPGPGSAEIRRKGARCLDHRQARSLSATALEVAASACASVPTGGGTTSPPRRRPSPKPRRSSRTFSRTFGAGSGNRQQPSCPRLRSPRRASTSSRVNGSPHASSRDLPRRRSSISGGACRITCSHSSRDTDRDAPRRQLEDGRRRSNRRSHRSAARGARALASRVTLH